MSKFKNFELQGDKFYPSKSREDVKERLYNIMYKRIEEEIAKDLKERYDE